MNMRSTYDLHLQQFDGIGAWVIMGHHWTTRTGQMTNENQPQSQQVTCQFRSNLMLQHSSFLSTEEIRFPTNC